MNFDFDQKEKEFREKIKDLFDQDSMAGLAGLEHAEMPELRQVTFKWFETLGQAGYLALGLDDGKNNVTLTAIQETLAVLSPSLFLAAEVSARIFGRLVAVYGTVDQKNEILPPLKEGRLIGRWLFLRRA